jgi:predicted RNase H-like HicB family nuclease
MRNEFTAIVKQDGAWFISYRAEVPGANGQGKTREECLDNLREAIALILEQRREDTLRSMPADAKQELVVQGTLTLGKSADRSRGSCSNTPKFRTSYRGGSAVTPLYRIRQADV